MSKKTKAAPQVAAPTIAKSNPLLDRLENQLYWHYGLLVLLPFFVFIKTANFEFIDFDDVAIIVNNSGIFASIKNIGLSFKTDAFLSANGDFYRPMQTVSYFLDAFIGGERPVAYHITNLVYHILTVVSVYTLLRLLNIRNLSALFASLIFSVHPLLASAISWIPSRGDILLGLFGMQMFICFIRYWKTNNIVWLVLSCLAFALAIFSKETAVLLPLLPLFYVFFLQQQKVNPKKVVPFFIACIGAGIFFYVLRSKVVVQSPPDFILGIKPLISNLPSIPIFFAKFFLPYGLSTMPLFDSAFTGIGFLMLVVALWFIIKSIQKKQWLVVLGFAWFVLFIVPPMIFKLYYSKFLLEYYEHRSYMPVIGLIIVLAFVLDKIDRYSKLYLWLPITLIFIFTFASSVHSDNFKNSIAFFGRGADLNNPGAATKRGEIYYSQRDVNSALADFEKAIETSDGQYPPAYFNRGNIRTNQQKDYRGAEEDYSKAIALDTSYIQAYINRANERILSSNFPGAMADLDKAQQFDKNNPDIYYTRAKAFTSSTKFEEALAMFTKTIAMDTNRAEVYNDRAFIRYRLKDYKGALEDCNKAISLFPEFLNAYYNKGMVYYETGKTKEAIESFDITLTLASNFYFGYFYRGMAKKQGNDLKGACADWQESVKLGFKQAEDTIRVYCK